MDEIKQSLYDACKAAAAVHQSSTPLGHQLHAAVAMADLGHVPRRPLSELLQREAEVIGAGLNADSIEQGEVVL